MEKKIGFIGCGNMGKAILGGLIASGQVLPGQIWVYTPSPDKVAALHDQYGINAAQSAQEVAQGGYRFRRGKTGHYGESAQ